MKYIILILFISFMVTYLLFGFVKLDFNVTNWTENARLGYVITSGFLTLGVLGIFLGGGADDDVDFY